jgi:hypothetical protein
VVVGGSPQTSSNKLSHQSGEKKIWVLMLVIVPPFGLKILSPSKPFSNLHPNHDWIKRKHKSRNASNEHSPPHRLLAKERSNACSYRTHKDSANRIEDCDATHNVLLLNTPLPARVNLENRAGASKFDLINTVL